MRNIVKSKILKIAIFFCVFSVVRSQTQFEMITADFCAVSSATDNLSCVNINQGTASNCFSRTLLCDGVNRCTDGGDESMGPVNSINCLNPPSSSTFNCDSNGLFTVSIDALCDGVDDCGGLNSASSGSDESLSLCENKCLLPYYGGCDLTRACNSARTTVSCSDCLDGYLLVSGTCLPIAIFNFELATYTVVEGATEEVCVLLSYPSSDINPLPAPISITVQLPAGASGDASFVTSNTLTFTTGNFRQCVTVSATNDNLQEPLEFHLLSMVLPIGDQFQLGAQGTSNILIPANDEPSFGFTTTVYSGVESSEQILVSVQRDAALGLSNDIVVTVSGSSSGSDTASAGNDYSSAQTVDFLFTPSGPTIVTQPFPIVNDNSDEASPETLTLSLNVPSGATIFGSNTAQGNIIDDDVLTVAFQQAQYTFLENTFSQVCLVPSSAVTLAPGQQRTFAVATAPSSVAGVDQATSTVDFSTTLNPASLDFNSGSSIICTVVNILMDGTNERQEVFSMIAIDAQNNQVSSTDVFITDIDLVEVEFVSSGPSSVPESNGGIEICVRLVSGILTSIVTVLLTPSAIGSALAGIDFGSAPVTATFASNAVPGAEACGTISILPDIFIEGIESFQVVGSSTDASFPPTPANANTIFVNIEDDDFAMFEFTQTIFNSLEDASQTPISVRLSSGSGELINQVNVVLSLQGSGGSATGGAAITGSTSTVDYLIASDVVTFAAGSGPNDVETSNTLVTLNDDIYVEENIETANILGTVQGSVGTFNINTATLQIVDNDVLEVSFQQPSYTMLEDSIQMVCLTNTGITFLAAGITLEASVITSPGSVSNPTVASASPGTDYTAALSPSTLSFSSNNVPACTSLTLLDDGVDEPEEVLTISANAVAGDAADLTIETPTVPVFITDIDLVIFEFSEMTYSVEEGGVAVMVCVDLVTGVIGVGGITVTVTNTGGTATADADYPAISQPLFFAQGTEPGTGSRQCFPLTATNDLAVENVENILLTATAPAGVMFTQQGNQATVDITDDDQVTARLRPPPGSASPDFTVGEDVDSLEVCVELLNTANLERQVVFNLATADGSGANPAMGSAPSDYQPISVDLTADVGDTEVCTDIFIIDDVLNEFAEVLNLVLTSSDPGANILNSPGSITIVDNDVSIINAPNSLTVSETAGTLIIPLTKSIDKAPGRECTVTAVFMDGTATAGSDYVGTVQTFVFDSSTAFQSLVVPIEDDNSCEGDEDFMVMLSASEGCMIAPDDSPISVTITDDELATNAGDDPHFSIILPGGKLLCYTVQGEHGFSFNLISNNKMTMNAKFVPDSRRSEVTWMGSMGIIVHDSSYKQSNSTGLRFEAIEKKIYIGDKVALEAKNIEKLSFKDGKLTITEAPPTTGYKRPSVYVDLHDVEIAFTIKYVTEHLDIFWHKTGGKVANSHGIIGQFFRKGVEIDEIRKILIMPNKEPVPVMRRPLWSFMEREDKQDRDDQLCWTAMNAGYQGEGLIDGTYFDYLVDDVMTGELKMKKF